MYSPARGRQVAPGGDADEAARGSDLGTGRDFAAAAPTARDRITVALIEDNRFVREPLTRFLNRSPDIQVIGGDPEGHPSSLREEDPDVVLLDLGLENGDSLRIARQVLRDFPDARVIVMDLPPGCKELATLVVAGVSGFPASQ